MIRGNERRNIFYDDEDRIRFIETLAQKKQKGAFYLPAFCLMDNHVHLAVIEGLDDIATVMKKITVSYVYFFNKKYKRVGHLFQDRFRSEAIENDRYLLAVTRYIHQNPVKAGLAKAPGGYRWSSYNGYFKEKGYFENIIDRDIVLDLFSHDTRKAQKLFLEFMNAETQDTFLDLKDSKEVMDEHEAKLLFNSMLKNRLSDQESQPANIPRELIIEFKAETGLSIRQIAAISGLKKNKVYRILKAT
jgi:putative transposase